MNENFAIVPYSGAPQQRLHARAKYARIRTSTPSECRITMSSSRS